MSTIKNESDWESEGLGIAGRQQVMLGGIEINDLIVWECGVRTLANGSVGMDIPTRPDTRVYRRIPVAKQGDLDHAPSSVPAAAPKALTHDDGKPPLANVPWAAVREMAMVQLYGAKKYNDYNNYRKGMEISRNLSCAVRHISDFMDGHDLDTESGRSHLAHSMCRLAFVLQNLADGVAVDDRYKGQK